MLRTFLTLIFIPSFLKPEKQVYFFKNGKIWTKRHSIRLIYWVFIWLHNFKKSAHILPPNVIQSIFSGLADCKLYMILITPQNLRKAKQLEKQCKEKVILWSNPFHSECENQQKIALSEVKNSFSF